MSNNTFGLVFFGIVSLWPISWLVLAIIYRRCFRSENQPTTLPKDLAEYYEAKKG